MLTVNLETALIKQNRKVLKDHDLLILKEYDRIAHLKDNDTLKRVGLDRVLNEGTEIKTVQQKLSEEIKTFNQERIFHVSQIKSLCEKYRLKFLSSRLYSGTIDEKLPARIENFEIAYGVECKSSNTYIMAPPESFRLEKKPKDPLFFYRINDEYYYLIHKWGNDLSIFRRFYSLLENSWFTWSFPTFILCLFAFFMHGIATFLTVLGLSLAIVYSLFCIGVLLIEEEPLTFLEKKEWNSGYY